jgi:FkbM family methyltransferase
MIKTILLRINFVHHILAICYSIVYKTKIKKLDKYWIHKKKKNFYINFHPIKNLDIFIENYKSFTKYYNPKKNDVIFDLGSGLGQETLYFSKKIGNRGKVFSFEPDPRLFNVMKTIISLNKLKNVKLYDKAFFSKNNKSIKFNLVENWMQNSINSNKDSKKYVKIKTITLDDVIKKNEINKIDFAKFNIEGAEKFLQNGNKKFLDICKNVGISCHDFIDGKEFKTFEIVKKILIRNNFEIKKNESKNKIFRYYLYARKKLN